MDKYARFVANRIFVANTRFLRLFCPDFYTDISDLTQILRRHLNKKLAAEASDSNPKYCVISCGRKMDQILLRGVLYGKFSSDVCLVEIALVFMDHIVGEGW